MRNIRLTTKQALSKVTWTKGQIIHILELLENHSSVPESFY